MVKGSSSGTRRRKFLVADDSRTIRLSLRDMLQRIGVPDDDIEEAENGMQTLEAFDIVRPDVVFLDVEMGPMDGAETLRALFEKEPALKVIVITGRPGDPRVAEMVSMGAFELLKKPIRREDLERSLALLDQEASDSGRIR